jgi:hypothetical protein
MIAPSPSSDGDIGSADLAGSGAASGAAVPGDQFNASR